MNLYENDPAHSEIVENINSVLNRYSYGYLIMAVLVQMSFLTANLPLFFEIGFMVAIMWIPLTIQFVANQICLRDIISSSKRKTLNRIQVQIREFHNGDITNKENIETINRLMDYHERIRKTPDSSLNVESVLRFLNQLILPLIAFLLGNLDTVIKFFAKP